MRYLLLKLFFLLISLIISAQCLAAPLIPGGYVTAPFQEANHYGHTHMGIDIALGSGTPILAPASGHVTHGSGNGYIYWCQIDCDDGTTYFVGDCRQDTLNCQTGNVSAGTVIGVTGGDAADSALGLGYSSGPHAHIEVFNGTGYVVGAQVDPVPYLQKIGVNMSGDLYPEGDGQHFGAHGSDNVELPWGVESMYELGSELNDVIKFFSEAASTGFDNLKPSIRNMFYLLAIIDLCYGLFKYGFSFSQEEFISKLMKYGFWIFIIANWDSLINEFFLSFISSVSGTIAGNTNIVSENLTQPQLIVQKCIFMLEPALNKIASYGSVDFVLNLHYIMPIFIVTWFTIVVYLLLACKIVINYVEFYFQSVTAFVVMPFNTMDFTEGWGRGSIGRLVACTVELTLRGILIYMAITFMKDASPGQIFSIVDNAGHQTYLTAAAVVKQFTICCNLLLVAFLIDKIPKNISRFFIGSIV